MTGCPRQLTALARTCFRPSSSQALIGIFCAAYLAWLATGGVNAIGTTAYVHLYFIPAVAGAWIGGCAGRIARWPGSRFSTPFGPTFGLVSALAGILVLAAMGLIAWISGLNGWPVVALEPLSMTAGLVSGCAKPATTTYVFLGLAILVASTTLLDARVSVPSIPIGCAFAMVVMFAIATPLIVRFTFQIGVSAPPLRPSRPRRQSWPPAHLQGHRFSGSSMGRVAVWSGLLATGCSFAHRLPTFEWRDGPLIVVIGSVCANLGVTSTSASFVRGPLPGVAWMLLSGVAKTRSDAGRQILWGVVANSAFAAGVFVALSLVFGPDWHLVEMMLVALAACHAYLAAACHSRWLLSSRLSVLVATPTVVALSAAAWVYGPWGLPTALAACLLTGVAAVYLGAVGMARIDIDPPPLDPAS